MRSPKRRQWGPTRFARGSLAPGELESNWLMVAVRARFPKLAAAMGDRAFGALLGQFMTAAPEAKRSLSVTDSELPKFLARAPEYPVWFSELAALDRAHIHVLHAPAVAVLARRALAPDKELRLVPAHAVVQLTTTVDELWSVLDRAAEDHQRASAKRPRSLDWPRTVLIWRRAGTDLDERTIEPDEEAALAAAVRGTTLGELAASLGGANPHARALDIVLQWVDDGVLIE